MLGHFADAGLHGPYRKRGGGGFDGARAAEGGRRAHVVGLFGGRRVRWRVGFGRQTACEVELGGLRWVQQRAHDAGFGRGERDVAEVEPICCCFEARDAQKFWRGGQESLSPELGRKVGQVRLVPLDAHERGAVTDGGSGNADAAEVFRDLLDQRRKRRFVVHVWLRLRGAETC